MRRSEVHGYAGLEREYAFRLTLHRAILPHRSNEGGRIPTKRFEPCPVRKHFNECDGTAHLEDDRTRAPVHSLATPAQMSSSGRRTRGLHIGCHEALASVRHGVCGGACPRPRRCCSARCSSCRDGRACRARKHTKDTTLQVPNAAEAKGGLAGGEVEGGRSTDIVRCHWALSS